MDDNLSRGLLDDADNGMGRSIDQDGIVQVRRTSSRRTQHPPTTHLLTSRQSTPPFLPFTSFLTSVPTTPHFPGDFVRVG